MPTGRHSILSDTYSGPSPSSDSRPLTRPNRDSGPSPPPRDYGIPPPPRVDTPSFPRVDNLIRCDYPKDYTWECNCDKRNSYSGCCNNYGTKKPTPGSGEECRIKHYGPPKPCNCPPMDCKGHWGPWSKCDKSCGPGKQIKNYIETQKAKHNGKACPAPQTRGCNIKSCCRPKFGGRSDEAINRWFNCEGQTLDNKVYCPTCCASAHWWDVQSGGGGGNTWAGGDHKHNYTAEAIKISKACGKIQTKEFCLGRGSPTKSTHVGRLGSMCSWNDPNYPIIY